MTPLDAMRRLAAHGLRDAHRGVCAVCEQWWTREDPGACPEIVHHLPDCPVPHLAGVVAALEIADRVAESMGWVLSDDESDTCTLCGATQTLLDDDDPDLVHEADCHGEALSRALKGGA